MNPLTTLLLFLAAAIAGCVAVEVPEDFDGDVMVHQTISIWKGISGSPNASVEAPSDIKFPLPLGEEALNYEHDNQ